jgi:ABC-type polysaccharide/polyol phosphate transport system ATPase subunit
MTRPAISFEHVWKKFRRGGSATPCGTPSQQSPSGPLPATVQLGDQGSGRSRDVSFEVRPGSAVGIIGPNSAGNSTTLKLWRIINDQGCLPCSWTRQLIEVAAGFHPDLTGRGTCFARGHPRHVAQSDAQLDAIVDCGTRVSSIHP